MYGAIVGDIIGSVYEGAGKYEGVIPAKEGFPLFSEKSRFTDDTVLTVALADALMEDGKDMESKFREYTMTYPGRWYGKGFLQWVEQNFSDPFTGKSFANGAAMRVSPIAWVFDDIKAVLTRSEKSAKVSHDHPEAIRGAQAVASAIHLARFHATKAEISSYIRDTFAYPVAINDQELQATHDLGCTSEYSVPTAIGCFLLGNDFEDTIRKAVMLGGDADTIAAISGAIAEAFYRGIPKDYIEKAKEYLGADVNGVQLLSITDRFTKQYLAEIYPET